MITFNQFRETMGTELLERQEVFGSEPSELFEEVDAAIIVPKELVISEVVQFLNGNGSEENISIIKKMIQNSIAVHTAGRPIRDLPPDLKELFNGVLSHLQMPSTATLEKLLDLSFGSQLKHTRCVIDLLESLSSNSALTDIVLKKYEESLLFNANDNSFYEYLSSSASFAKNAGDNQKVIFSLLDKVLANDYGNENKKMQVFQSIFDMALKSSNASLMHYLKDKHSPLYEYCFHKLEDNRKQFLNKILSYEDPAFFSKHMLQFSNGFGNINYEGALFTAAQIKDRKENRKDNPYLFNPTILKEDQFPQYLEILKKLSPSQLPCTERFILTGLHWLSGQIKIDKNGNAELLLIDSLGHTEDMRVRQGEKALEAFAKTFPNVPGSQHRIYFDETQRQDSSKGCSMYSIDDALHLYTVESRLPPSYAQSALTGYLESHRQDEKKWLIRAKGTSSEVRLTQLPLQFMRTIQKPERAERMLSKRSTEEVGHKLNKKGQTIKESTQQDFVENARSKWNVRLERKLDQTAKYNLGYLFSKKESEIKAEMQSFTLEAFEKRMLARVDSTKSAKQTSEEVRSRPHPILFRASSPQRAPSLTSPTSESPKLQQDDSSHQKNKMK